MRYLYTFTAVSVVVLLCVGGFNYFIDPYNIYYSQELHQIEMEKPVVYRTLRLHKAYAVSRHKPEMILIGSSKVQQGYDPESRYIPYRNNYNLGLVRASAYETLKYIKHSAASGGLKSVFLAVDLFSYNAYLPNRSDFDESRLNLQPGPVSGLVKASDIMPTLLSVSALTASADTLANSTVGDRPLLLSNGLENPLTLRNELRRSGGNLGASLIIEEQFANSFMSPEPFRKFDFYSDRKRYDTLATFTKILKFCQRENLELKIVINPFHAVHYVMYEEMGRWEYFEQWKRQLVAINDTVASENDSVPYDLWDFTAINEVTTELFPQATDVSNDMKYFWETVHFKTNVGNYILGKVYNTLPEVEQKSWPAGFGKKIDKDNIENHLKVIRAAVLGYEAQNRGKLAQFIEKFDAARKYLERETQRMKISATF